MNIITNADVEKFLKLIKAGMQHGEKRELKNYTNASSYYDETSMAKEFYVSVQFSFNIDANIINSLFDKEDLDISNKVNDLL